jgi:hypothetical protein
MSTSAATGEVQGPQGPTGNTGATGANGTTGAAGPAPTGTGFVRVTSGVLENPATITLDTDGTLAANSNTRVPSQQAVKTYADTKGVGSVTHTGNLDAHKVVVGNGTADEKVLSAIGATNTVLHGNTGADPGFSAVVEGDISLSAVTTNDVTTTQHGFCPVLPNVSTQFLNGVGGYSVPAGVAAAPVGSPVIIGVDEQQGTTNVNWQNYTIRWGIRYSALLCVPAKWKIRFAFNGGTSCVIAKAMIRRVAKNTVTPVIDSTNFTFAGGAGMPYTDTFGFTASGASPAYLDSDPISIQLDVDHNYWVYLFFSNVSANSSLSLISIPLASIPTAVFSWTCPAKADTGDQTGESSVPICSSGVTGTASWASMIGIYVSS